MSQSNKYVQELQNVKKNLTTASTTPAQSQTTANKPYLTLSEIPTKNKLQIIDNYSPKYNYIVEGDKIYYSIKGRDYWVDISNNSKARKNLLEFLSKNYDFKGYEDGEKEQYEQNIKESNKQEQKQPFQKEEFEQNKKMLQKLKPLPEPKQEIPIALQDATLLHPRHFVPASSEDDDDNTTLLEKISRLASYPLGWIQRKKDMWFTSSESDNAEEAAGVAKVDPIDTSGAAIRTLSTTQLGDTIPVTKRTYVLPQNLNINEYQWGVRNRNDVTPLETPGGLITSFHPFRKKSTFTTAPAGTFIGITPEGQFRAGGFAEFGPDDYLTRSYANDVIGLKTDESGNIVYKNDGKHGNPKSLVPVTLVKGEDGSIDEGSLNILTWGTTPAARDARVTGVSGGKIIARVGDHYRLLIGSIGQIHQEIERMKAEYNVPHVTLYTLDNGSFNQGIRTFDGKLTRQDLLAYDRKNRGGGNFLYIKQPIQTTPQFQSDTIFTPNIRTTASESYLKGHPLQNEMKGVVLHHTAFMDPDVTKAIGHMTNPKTEASAHVLIGFDGKRTVLAEPDKVTFHAGQSMFNGRLNVNDFMLGIEFQGDTGKRPLTDQQIQSAVEYLKPIILKYRIPLSSIVTHENIRDAYNEYAAKNGMKKADRKVDINQANYQRIIQALLNEVYYIPSSKKYGGSINYLDTMRNVNRK